MAAKITWQEKVRRLIGWPKKGACVDLARRIGEPSRTVYGWLRWNRSPRNESDVLRSLARALRVPQAWLEDGAGGDPPLIGKGATQALLDSVAASEAPEDFKQVVYALTDADACAFLAEQLRVYRRTVDPKRAPR